ncbi:UNVERIFIED_CONTAM: peptidoglycan/xylan/chitin deacetylase (PgdA/CDA1 family) [Brevibacillus sp. OAP136]
MSGTSSIWPNEAQCAVTITVNLDAEFFWLSMFPDSITRPKTLSMGQYGPNRGLERVLDVFDRFGVKATFFIPGRVAEVYPEQVKEIVARGHEIGHHGYAHENFGHLSAEEQHEALVKGLETLGKVAGVRPVGFRAPEGEMTKDTLKLVRELGFEYSSSMFGDDRPEFVTIEGEENRYGGNPASLGTERFPLFCV